MDVTKLMDSPYYKAGRTLFKTFVVTVLGQLIVFGNGILGMSMLEWKAVSAAGIAAVILTGYNALNPSYNDYGISRIEESNPPTE